MKTPQASWQNYRDHVVPDDAGDVQLKETEMAFYAGALSTFQLMLAFSDYPEETATQMIDTLNQEIELKCKEFIQP